MQQKHQSRYQNQNQRDCGASLTQLVPLNAPACLCASYMAARLSRTSSPAAVVGNGCTPLLEARLGGASSSSTTNSEPSAPHPCRADESCETVQCGL